MYSLYVSESVSKFNSFHVTNADTYKGQKNCADENATVKNWMSTKHLSLYVNIVEQHLNYETVWVL